MEPAPWTTIYNRVKSVLPGAIDADIRQEVSAVMVDFTQDTNVWTEQVPLTIQSGVNDYPVTLSAGTPHRLMVVFDPELGNFPKWSDSGISMQVPGIIHFWRVPSDPVTLQAVIAKATSTPAMAGTPPKATGYPVIDDWIVERYNDVIYYGVLHYLYRRPAKTYSNATAAKDNEREYKAAKALARADVQRMNTYGAQTWTYPQSWATVGRKGWA